MNKKSTYASDVINIRSHSRHFYLG